MNAKFPIPKKTIVVQSQVWRRNSPHPSRSSWKKGFDSTTSARRGRWSGARSKAAAANVAAATSRITCRGSRSAQTPAARTMPAFATWRAARTSPRATGEFETSSTAKASATFEIPSPTPEIVVLEKSRRKFRSASAPTGSLIGGNLRWRDGAALQPARRRGALAEDVGGGRPLQRRGRRSAPELHDLLPAAQRHRRAASRACAERLDPGHTRSLAPHARLQHALSARVRPRRDLDAERDREAARRGGPDAAGPRARGVRRANMGVARADRAHDLRAAPHAGRLDGLPAGAVHAGRGIRARRD